MTPATPAQLRFIRRLLPLWFFGALLLWGGTLMGLLAGGEDAQGTWKALHAVGILALVGLAFYTLSLPRHLCPACGEPFFLPEGCKLFLKSPMMHRLDRCCRCGQVPGADK